MAVEVRGRQRLGGLLHRLTEPRECRVAAASRPGLLRRLQDAPSMDRHAVVLRPDLDYVMVAAFAGHGPHGAKIADLAADVLSDVLERRLLSDHHPLQHLHHQSSTYPCSVPVELAIQDAFVEANIAIDATPWAKHSGTTATVCVMRAGKLYVGSVGDCTVLLGKRKAGLLNLLRLSIPHSVQYGPGEKERVERFGGVIHAGFVSDENENRSLAMTRTLGDTDMRKAGVCQLPQIASCPVTHRDSVVFLSTVPLWSGPESVAPPDLSSAVENARDGPFDLSRRLLDVAFGDVGPANDATVICMQLRRFL